MHYELALLVKAPVPPLDALRSAALSPARFLNAADRLGSIQRGKVADLVLLDANPLQDITSTQRINAVITNGRYHRAPRSMACSATPSASPGALRYGGLGVRSLRSRPAMIESALECR